MKRIERLLSHQTNCVYMFHEKLKNTKSVQVVMNYLFVRAVGEIWQSFIFLRCARRLALVLPAFPCIQTASIENFFGALYIIFDIVVEKI